MTVTYDPEAWLVSLDRALKDYVVDALNDSADTAVEMSFPDTRSWTKELPLAKALIHFEQDSEQSVTVGLGSPGDDVLNDDDPENVTNLHREAVWHLVNFDVGVWVSAKSGGATKRKELVQALKNIFVPPLAKTSLLEATQGIWVVSFDGGRNELDRIADIPVWRAVDMTLIVKVTSRHVPVASDIVPGAFVEDEQLTITSEDGTTKPVVTP